jgi:DEAD/DEAH box helicase domain-containing protein
MPAWVASDLSEVYQAKGIKQLYSHQAMTAELVRNGKNVVVVTPTASGKTLCYNLPVLNAVLENPDTRALYLFPTKALAQDQLAELQDLARRLDDGFGVFTYDGDTPSDARKAIREGGHIVLTNPDMLHTGILPHHTRWMRLFENLRYIVLDELHFLPRSVRQPRSQCLATIEEGGAVLRLEAPVHLLFCDHREPWRNGVTTHRKEC